MEKVFRKDSQNLLTIYQICTESCCDGDVQIKMFRVGKENSASHRITQHSAAGLPKIKQPGGLRYVLHFPHGI